MTDLRAQVVEAMAQASFEWWHRDDDDIGDWAIQPEALRESFRAAASAALDALLDGLDDGRVELSYRLRLDFTALERLIAALRDGGKVEL